MRGRLLVDGKLCGPFYIYVYDKSEKNVSLQDNVNVS